MVLFERASVHVLLSCAIRVVKESKGIWQKYCAVICLNAAVKIALEGGFCPNISGARSVHREVKSFCLWTREGAVLLSSGVSPTTDYYCSTHIEHLFVLSQRLAVAQTIYRILYLCVCSKKSDFLVCGTSTHQPCFIVMKLVISWAILWTIVVLIHKVDVMSNRPWCALGGYAPFSWNVIDKKPCSRTRIKPANWCKS